MTEISKWLVANQALLVSIAIPMFTIFVGFFGSYLVHRAKVDEIRLTGRIKLSEYRKQNFDELQDLVDRLHSVVEAASMRIATRDENDKTIPKKELSELMLAAQEIMARIRADEVQVSAFSKAITRTMDHLYATNADMQSQTENPIVELRKLCHQLLAAEWKLIENELKRLA